MFIYYNLWLNHIVTKSYMISLRSIKELNEIWSWIRKNLKIWFSSYIRLEGLFQLVADLVGELMINH